jgi:bifunctional non-homologous end joining protein LigD
MRRALQTESLEPMYASVGHEVPTGRLWRFEPKYDGIRVLAHVTRYEVALMTRNGRNKAPQFPGIVAELRQLATWAKRPFIVDGEIVALHGNIPARFQSLQARMHVKEASDIATHEVENPAAIILFDILLDGDVILLNASWTIRRQHLRRLLSVVTHTRPLSASVARHLRLSLVRKDGTAMMLQALRNGWEGVMAKRIDFGYQPGVRTDAWRKLKVEFREEFVVGGFTKPRNTRKHIGALLLGAFDTTGQLVYVGHMGGGFTRTSVAEMRHKLDPLVRKTSPFSIKIHPNEPATWVQPRIVVEVKFSEWTDDGRLRQPIYLGTRDDKDARDVMFEPESMQRVEFK